MIRSNFSTVGIAYRGKKSISSTILVSVCGPSETVSSLTKKLVVLWYQSHLEEMIQLPGKGDFVHEIWAASRQSRVPDTFQLGAIPDGRAFLACPQINSLAYVFSRNRNIPPPPASTIFSIAVSASFITFRRSCQYPPMTLVSSHQ